MGVLLLAEMLPWSKGAIDNTNAEAVGIASRIGAEYGADFVKTEFRGQIQDFRKVTEMCQIPVLVTGGEKMKTTQEVLQITSGIMSAGAKGVVYGRNIWQHEDPEAMIRALAKIIHEGSSVDEALKLFRR
jgi:DhnA family fructose-bisphosphate aldolase class Ia